MMKKYTFDAKNSLWYEQCGEYRLPCLTVPNSKPIGIWGQRHRRYLRQHSVSISTVLTPPCCLWLRLICGERNSSCRKEAE